jgi:hypothetical protein
MFRIWSNIKVLEGQEINQMWVKCELNVLYIARARVEKIVVN